MKKLLAVMLGCAAIAELAAALPEGVKSPPAMTPAGGRKIAVVAETAEGAALTAEFEVPLLAAESVTDQPYKNIPVFNPKVSIWGRGVPMTGVFYDAVVPGSLRIFSAPEGGGTEFKEKTDYVFFKRMSRFGKTEPSGIGDGTIYLSYQHRPQRLDSVVLAAGRLEYRTGVPAGFMPRPPALKDGEVRLGNVYLPFHAEKIDDGNLYPILEAAPPPSGRPTADELLPSTMKKLREGGKIKILAWGDSITNGTYIPDWREGRWQNQFVAALKARFPKAEIELVTEAWGGRTTTHFLNQKPGAPHNYQEKVLEILPDLVISEFHNDRAFGREEFERNYERIRRDFQSIEAEWLIMVPPYTAANLYEEILPAAQKNIDHDTRPYTVMLREFTAKHRLPLADGGTPFVRLWRQGIPRLTVMTNNSNHPNRAGLKLLADAVLAVFPEK